MRNSGNKSLAEIKARLQMRGFLPPSDESDLGGASDIDLDDDEDDEDEEEA
jgi:hypothetical protein